MEQALLIGRFVSALGFTGLGVLAVRDWVRHRGADRAYLAGAFGLLGLVAVAARVHELLGYRRPLISDVTVALFLASGYFLLLFRHTFVPLPKKVLALAFAVVSATSIAIIALKLPTGPDPEYTSSQFAAVVAFCIVWGLCVGEPAFRFWRAARGRPRVQKARLRSLAYGYGGILAILTFALSAGRPGLDPTTQLITQILTIALIPILHASFAPPEWLRAVWRRGEDEVLRAAIDDLIAFSGDLHELCRKALDSGLMVVGSKVGFLALPDSGIMVASGISESDARALFERLPPGSVPRMDSVVAGDHNNSAIVIPLKTVSGTGALVVISSSFTPLFGSDEIRTLTQYAWSIGLALERIGLADRLSKSEHRLVEAQHVAQLGSFEWHPKNGALAWSDEHFRIWGLEPRDAVTFQDFISGVHPDDRERVLDVVDQALGSREDIDIEYRVVRPDDSVRIVHERAFLRVDAKTREEVMIGSVQDITDRKEAELLLDEQRQLYESLLTAAGDLGEGIAIVDLATNRFVWANNAAAEIYGYSTDELLALEDVGALTPPEEVERMREMRARWDDGALGPLQEHLMLKKDGTRIHVESASKALDGTEVISVFRDVTDRKESELALQDAYERERAAADSLRELDEMKNTFLSAVSHDLRTPLTAVLGFARTLEARGAQLSPAETRELVGRISDRAERLHRMLVDLLDLDRLQRGILEARRIPTRIDELVVQSVESLDLPSHQIDLDCDEFTFPVDPAQVERIVENLVINAARHTPPGTRVSIRVRNLISAVSIEVQDDGPGVPDHLKASIFERFRQGDGPHLGGTGLGLSLVTRFAELHGGSAWVEDAPGGGSIFKVHLLETTPSPAPQRPKRVSGSRGRRYPSALRDAALPDPDRIGSRRLDP